MDSRTSKEIKDRSMYNPHKALLGVPVVYPEWRAEGEHSRRWWECEYRVKAPNKLVKYILAHAGHLASRMTPYIPWRHAIDCSYSVRERRGRSEACDVRFGRDDCMTSVTETILCKWKYGKTDANSTNLLMHVRVFIFDTPVSVAHMT